LGSFVQQEALRQKRRDVLAPQQRKVQEVMPRMSPSSTRDAAGR
jgi:hypothetical protein